MPLHLTSHYSDVLSALGQQPGLLGDIFSGSQSRFSNPVNLKKLLSAIDETEWTALDVNVKADAFEGLLEKAASEGKKGAGQYFTPRLLIKAIVRCMQPDPRRHRSGGGCWSGMGEGCGNVECRKVKCRRNDEVRRSNVRIRTSTFGFHSSFGIRHSTLRACVTPSA